MNLTQTSIDKRTLTIFATVVFSFAGVFAFTKLGQLEDPTFTVKTASITTTYPGASPQEVEQEVTDRIELSIQQMTQVKNVYSISRPGLSIVKVDIRDEYRADQLPQVWDEMRKKIRDTESSLPPGAGVPKIGDDFGYVYGFLLAVTGDGFNYQEIDRHAKDLKRELSLVDGVARVELWGNQQRAIYLDTSQAKLSQLGVPLEAIEATLKQQNMIVKAGSLDVQNERLRIDPTGAFVNPAEIGDLVIRSRDITGAGSGAPEKESQLLRIRDIAEVREGYIDPPSNLMRHNGQQSIAIALAPLDGTNVVKVGNAVKQRLNELRAQLPVGIEVELIAFQSDLVAESIKVFIVNLLEAIIIVFAVLALTMGMRMGVIVSVAGLLLVILLSFVVMKLWGIDLQRMSLGALIIAMGMMVDNAIVVADGYSVGLQRGMKKIEAALESVKPAMPLLGATVIAVMAFYPIFGSQASAGEYCKTLFQVVATSLLLSWVLSVTVTPLMCMTFLPMPKAQASDAPAVDPYAGALFKSYRGLLAMAIRFRWFTIALAIALLVVSLAGFKHVRQMFFPDSVRPQFMVDYWAPEGTRIQTVSEDIKALEAKLRADPRVSSVSAFIGQGPPRFYLPVDPELPYPSYAQLVVNVPNFKDVDAIMKEFEPQAVLDNPQAQVFARKFGVGPGTTWKFQARFSGPADAKPEVLRSLADQGMEILRKSPICKVYRNDWREPVKKVVPIYNQQRGRWTGVSRPDLAAATERAFDGQNVGLYREEDELFPIVLRYAEAERQNAATLDAVQVRPAFGKGSLPLSAITTGVNLEWENPIIWRWDRRRAVTVQAIPANGVTLPTLRNSVLKEFDAIKLPPGYKLEWDGEFEDTKTSQSSLIPPMAPAGLVMILVLVALFNAYRPPLLILLVIPFGVIGVVSGLLMTGAAFGFMALLGAMSLSGMMIKNSIVLLDQLNIELKEGKPPYQAVMDASISRLRPVFNAAATTVFGMAPLLLDVFWVSMAVAIMFGLTFGTLLTMVLLPVLYATFYRIPTPSSGSPKVQEPVKVTPP